MRFLLTIFLFLFVSCSGDPRNEKQRVRQNVGSAVVKIFGKTSSGFASGGTGFSVQATSGRRYILTNSHICSLADKNGDLTVDFPRLNRRYKRRIIERSLKHDLCLVESLPSFKPSLMISNKVNVGEEIFVVGHPKLFALTVSKGEFIEDTSIVIATNSNTNRKVVIKKVPFTRKTREMLVRFKTYPSSRFIVYSRGGNSGSPIVNDKGFVVSVLFAGNPYDVMETYGVPLSYVQDFLKGY